MGERKRDSLHPLFPLSEVVGISYAAGSSRKELLASRPTTSSHVCVSNHKGR